MHTSILLFLASIASLANGQLLRDKSVACSASTMDVTFTFRSPFTGSVFTEKGFTSPVCSSVRTRKKDGLRWKGDGGQTLTVRIPMLNGTQCGVQTNETAGSYTVKLIASPVEGLIVDGFSAVSVRCLYSTQDITLTLPPGPNGTSALEILGTKEEDGSVVTGTGGSPSLTMHILDGHGIDGPVVARAAVGQRITLDVVMKNTAIYDFYVHSCYAHDGSNTPDASINIVDTNGCGVRLSRAVDVPAMTNRPSPGAPKHVYLNMYGFQFTSSNFVHFECQVKPCVHSCHREQCEAEEDQSEKIPLIPALRKRRDERKLATLHLQTVLEIEPQSATKAALVAEAPLSSSETSCVSYPSLLFISTLLCLATASIVCLLYSTRRSVCSLTA